MLSNFIIRSTAALGGAPFRLAKRTALGSAGSGVGAGAAVVGIPGALVGGALGVASSLLGGLFGKHNTNNTNLMNYKIMQEQNRFNAEATSFDIFNISSNEEISNTVEIAIVTSFLPKNSFILISSLIKLLYS